VLGAIVGALVYHRLGIEALIVPAAAATALAGITATFSRRAVRLGARQHSAALE
jgi:predicted MFS family arabinose efflux permease